MTSPSGPFVPAAPVVTSRAPGWLLALLAVALLTGGAYLLGVEHTTRAAAVTAQALRDSAAQAQVTIAARSRTIAAQARALVAQRTATDTAVQHARTADRALQALRARVQVASPTTLVVRQDTAAGTPADTIAVPALVVQRIQAADAARDSSASALVLARTEIAGLRVHVDTLGVQNQALQDQVGRWTREAEAERRTGQGRTTTAWVKGALTGGAVGAAAGALAVALLHR